MSYFNKARRMFRKLDGAKVHGGQGKNALSGIYVKERAESEKYFIKVPAAAEPTGDLLCEFLASAMISKTHSKNKKAKKLFSQYKVTASTEGYVGLVCKIFAKFKPLYKHRKFGHNLNVMQRAFNRQLNDLPEKQKEQLATILATHLLISNTDPHTENVGFNGENIVTFDYDRAFDLNLSGPIMDPFKFVAMFGRKGTQPTNHIRDYRPIVEGKYFVKALEQINTQTAKLDLEAEVALKLKQMREVTNNNARWLKELRAFAKNKLGAIFPKNVTLKTLEPAVKSLVAESLKQRAVSAGLLAKVIDLKINTTGRDINIGTVYNKLLALNTFVTNNYANQDPAEYMSSYNLAAINKSLHLINKRKMYNRTVNCRILTNGLNDVAAIKALKDALENASIQHKLFAGLQRIVPNNNHARKIVDKLKLNIATIKRHLSRYEIIVSRYNKSVAAKQNPVELPKLQDLRNSRNIRQDVMRNQSKQILAYARVCKDRKSQAAHCRTNLRDLITQMHVAAASA